MGFAKCTSFCGIEFSSSFEIIGDYGFKKCSSLIEIIFASNSQMEQMQGFRDCSSVWQIELPPLSQIVSGFFGCARLRIIVIDARCRLKYNNGIRNIRPFLFHEDQEVKDNRTREFSPIESRLICHSE
jgi:hypothetical protein